MAGARLVPVGDHLRTTAFREPVRGHGARRTALSAGHAHNRSGETAPSLSRGGSNLVPSRLRSRAAA